MSLSQKKIIFENKREKQESFENLFVTLHAKTNYTKVSQVMAHLHNLT